MSRPFKDSNVAEFMRFLLSTGLPREPAKEQALPIPHYPEALWRHLLVGDVESAINVHWWISGLRKCGIFWLVNLDFNS